MGNLNIVIYFFKKWLLIFISANIFIVLLSEISLMKSRLPDGTPPSGEVFIHSSGVPP